MAIIYKVKFTRDSTDDKFPFSHFYDSIRSDYAADNDQYTPLQIPMENWYEFGQATGYVEWDYEEHDAGTDAACQAYCEQLVEDNGQPDLPWATLATRLDYVTLTPTTESGGQPGDTRYGWFGYNATSLTHTVLVTFNTQANLETWAQYREGKWATATTGKADLATWLTDNSQTIVETVSTDDGSTWQNISAFPNVEMFDLS